MKKLPLQNTQTKKIPVGPRIRKEIAKVPSLRSQSAKEKDGSHPTQDMADSAECPLEKPTSFTLDKLKKVIHETKNCQPNITKMVEDKLASPNTAKYIRKKKASKVNIAESTKVYEDLVSLDVSGTNLIAGIEEDLRRRACHVQPPSRPPDPKPSLTDYFREEEFLNVRRVGASDIFPLPVQQETFTANRQKLTQYTDVLLG